jgi:hypothetical protein
MGKSRVAPAPEPDGVAIDEEDRKWLDSSETGAPAIRSLKSVTETQTLQIMFMNYNLHGKSCPDAPSRLFPRDSPHHLYVMGAVECERSIAKSVVTPTKDKWEKALNGVLGDECTCIASVALVATCLTIYARNDVANQISNVKATTVSTGIGGMIGNKGGIRLSFDFGGTSMLFIHSHLPSGQKKTSERDASAARLLGSDQPDGPRTAIDGFDRVFFLGDLNYRVNCTREEADRRLAVGDNESLLAKDQLRMQLATQHLYRDFSEGAIAFPPTYKFDQGTNIYDTSKKQRVPAWTDRILWLACPEIKLVAYDSLKEVKNSDHRPVFAQFDVGVSGLLDDEQGTAPSTVREAHRGQCAIM